MLTPAQLAAFSDDGFLLIPGLFGRDELAPVVAEIERKVDRLALALQRSGLLRELHADAGFYQRLTLIERDCPGASVLFHTQGVLEPALATLWSHPRLLDIMEQLLGPEISGHPVWNIRAKTPRNPLATVPWHQDTAYLEVGSERCFQPAAWIPLLDADGLNGTLQFVRGAHRAGTVYRHQLEREGGKAGSWYIEIPDRELPRGERRCVPVAFGSVLLLNQLVPHRSTENLSENIRWSVDLRWQRSGDPTGMSTMSSAVRMRGRGVERIDWSGYFGVNRAGQLPGFGITDPSAAAGAIRGPWMDRWATAAAGSR